MECVSEGEDGVAARARMECLSEGEDECVCACVYWWCVRACVCVCLRVCVY